MPSAGAVVPPVITPLRKAVPGRPSTHIDTATFIELDTETRGCKIYFTTDGSKPMPFQPRIGGREYTFKYRGPFTLKVGKRILKAVAVTRDGLHESNIVTKTFLVDDAGDPPSDVDLDDLDTDLDLHTTSDSLRHSMTGSLKKKGRKNKSGTVKEAWGSLNSSSNGWHHLLEDNNNELNQSLAIPDQTFQPAGYMNPQMNFWGAPTSSSWNQTYQGVSYPSAPVPYYDKTSQLGYMTENIIRNIEQPKLTIGDVKRLMTQAQIQQLQNQPPPIDYQDGKDPDIQPESPGHGDWRGQLDHIYAHLLNRCKTDIYFRTLLGKPKLGMIAHVDIDEEDDSYLFTVIMTKPGARIKPRINKPSPAPPEPAPAPAPAPVRQPVVREAPPPREPAVRHTMKSIANAAKITSTIKKDPPKPDPPKPKVHNLKTIANAAKITATNKKEPPKPDPPKPKEAPKPKPKQPKPVEEKKEKPVEDPYFETEEYEQEGTLKPWPTFNSEYDCEALRKAMKGAGTDEEAIVNILGYRVSTQRQEICVMFKTMFGKNLRDELEGELSGDFRRACKALCLPPAEYDATEVHKSIKGLGTDEDALIEILCTRTNSQIKLIKEVYKKLYNKEMEKDVRGDTSGDFQKLLVYQMSGNRDESTTFDRTAAKRDAEALFQAGEKKRGTDESMFTMILCQRSFAHLRAVFEEYQALSKKTMDEVIKSEFSGDIKDALRTVVSVIQNKPLYFAKKMQKSMKGLGTDDESLIRVVVSRCECDMVQIKEAFEWEFKKSLADWLRGDTSGDFMQILLALTGDRPPPSPTVEEIEATQGEPEIEEIEQENYPEEGTVKPADPFDPKKDCEVLKKAMQGFGTDEEAIIEVWGRRTIKQRIEIISTYRSMFNKDLLKELKSETSGNFMNLLVGLGQAAEDYDANELRRAMKGLGTDEDTLIEILCTRTNEQLTALKEAYTRLHKRDLEKDIISETSGHLKRILISMVQANRPASGNTIDRRKARNDAKALAEAGEDKFGTDESRFNVILCSSAAPYLIKTVATPEGGDTSILVQAREAGGQALMKEPITQPLLLGAENNSSIPIIREPAGPLWSSVTGKQSAYSFDSSAPDALRSFPQLRATFEEYTKTANKDIEDSIKAEMSGDLKNAMLTVVRCVRDKAAQFAMRLHKAMKGAGTDDNTLVRVCVTRSEVDMVQIKEAFQRLYDQPLGKYIADDTSGDYRRLILTVIGAEEFKKK